MAFIVTARIEGSTSRSKRLTSTKAVKGWLSDKARQSDMTWRSTDGMFSGLFLNESGSECGRWDLATQPKPQERLYF